MVGGRQTSCLCALLTSNSMNSNADDNEEDEILTLTLGKELVPKISGRKRDTSQAKWLSVGSFAGMAEIIKFKGKLLQTTGIVRDGKVLLHVEEMGYLMQREALQVFKGNSLLTIMDLYKLIMAGDCGCSWDGFKVYLELKTLGYIVARHGVPWSTSMATLDNSGHRLSQNHISSMEENVDLCGQFEGLNIRSSQGKEDEHLMDGIVDIGAERLDPVHMHSPNITSGCASTLSTREYANFHHRQDFAGGLSNNLYLLFDIYAPNSKFKKKQPGVPEFTLCIISDHPPQDTDLKALCAQNGGVPIKIVSVDGGRVNFFEFNKVNLPSMP